MSDTDRDATERGHEAMRNARTAVLRERKQEFVTEHGRSENLKALRQRVSGRSMSDLVIEDHDDRV